MKKNSTIIHLGMPKTATTTLQNHLFAQHSQVHYLGKFAKGRMPKSMNPALLASKRDATPIELGDIRDASISEQLAYADKHDLRPVMSREGLSHGLGTKKFQQALLFKSKFGDCKIILFIREPVSFVRSYYAEMLKAYQTRVNKKGWMALLPPAPHYFDINEYLAVAAKPRGPLMTFLSVADTAQIYSWVFGRTNVKIYLFEAFCNDMEKTSIALCNDIGIDSKEALELMGQKRANTRISTGYIHRLQEIEASGKLAGQFQQKNSKDRLQMLSPDISGEKIDPQPSKEWIKKIELHSVRQNRRLVKKWGLPLADYGYLV